MRFRKTEQEWLVEVCLILKKGKKEKDVRVGKNKGEKEHLIKKQASNTNGCCAQRANKNKKEQEMQRESHQFIKRIAKNQRWFC